MNKGLNGQDRQIDRRMNRKTEGDRPRANIKLYNRLTDRYTYTHTHSQRERERERERQTDRQTETEHRKLMKFPNETFH
jgi:hypothetical protein